MLQRVEALSEKVDDERLDILQDNLVEAHEISQRESDPESVKQAHESVLESKRTLAKVRKDHLADMRQIELDRVTSFFEDYAREYAKPTEITAFNNMRKTAQRALKQGLMEFENYLDEMKGMNWQVLWRQDWFIVDTFKSLSEEDGLFTDKVLFEELVRTGIDAVQRDDIEELRNIVLRIYQIRVVGTSYQDIFLPVNII